METRSVQIGSSTVVFEFEPGWNQTGQSDDIMLGIFAQLTVDYEDGVRNSKGFEWLADVYRRAKAAGAWSGLPRFQARVVPDGHFYTTWNSGQRSKSSATSSS